MATKDRIYPGDTLPVAYECRMPDEDNPNNSNGLPATPTIAVARVFNSTVGEFLEIGGPGVFEDAVAIEAQEGNGQYDKGGVLRYTVDSVFTVDPGDYTLFITATFANGVKLTENRKYKIEEYR
jgi:hypothetical protein